MSFFLFVTATLSLQPKPFFDFLPIGPLCCLIMVGYQKDLSKEGKIMDGLRCPICGKEVHLISFGSGWVGVCCNKLVYNRREFPFQNSTTGDESHSPGATHPNSPRSIQSPGRIGGRF